MTYHPVYELVPCEIKGCGAMHGVRVVSSNVSPLRSGSDSDLTAGMGAGAREGASGSERSGFDDRFIGSRMDHPLPQASGATGHPASGNADQAGAPPER